MKELYPSFVPPEKWRINKEDKTNRNEWARIKSRIKNRDDYTCKYCGFKAEKYQIVHHIDDDPNNNDDNNLETLCPMCSLIHHTGFGCNIQNVVDLYEKSDYSQNEIVQITRKMRANYRNDQEIITFLGLENKTSFKMNNEYLKNLFSFITSRKAKKGWIQKGLEYEYEYEIEREKIRNKKYIKPLDKFL